MNCTNCNYKIKKDSLFCTKCGFSVTTKTRPNKTPSLWIIIILAMLTVIGNVYISGNTDDESNSSTKDLIRQTVAEVKNETTLPQQIDDVTKLVDITAEDNAIRYHYILSGIDTANISNSVIKESVLSGACNNKNVLNTLNADINMQYSYKVASSNQTYFVEITSSDCK